MVCIIYKPYPDINEHKKKIYPISCSRSEQ